MSFFKLNPSLYLLTFIHLLLQNASADYCLTSTNFTADDPYDKNLIKLANYLTYEIPLTGFSLGSKGNGQNKVYGLSMSLGHFSTTVCQNCITEAENITRQYCPYNKGAAIWNGVCHLKYLDFDFLGKLERSDKFVAENPQNMSYRGLVSVQKIGEMLSNLSTEALGNPRMLGIGSIPSGEEVVTCVAQCKMDISNSDCKWCLDDSIKLLPQCCDAKRYEVVYGGSCVVAYKFHTN